MYEYVGNVVKMVQVRGRGRAEDSRCFLISSRKECIEKEKLNMFKEKMVEEAIEQLQKQPDISNQVDKLQKDDKTRRDLISASPEKPKTQGSYELLCSKCKRFACMSDDIRVVQDLPLLKIQSFVVRDCVTGRQEYFRKWRDVPAERLRWQTQPALEFRV